MLALDGANLLGHSNPYNIFNEKWDGHTADEDYYGENKTYNWYLIVKPDYSVETTYFTGQVMLVR